MFICTKGLLHGERLAKCSDEAHLHFPRLAAISNGLGRIELNLRLIQETAYGNFNNPPTHEQLTCWIKEYADAHLLFIYEGPDGHPWGQWRGTPDSMLPKYKTAADKKSPAPPAEALAKFDEGYARLKLASGDFLNISEHFGNVPKSSEDSGSVRDVSADDDVEEEVDEEKVIHPVSSRATKKLTLRKRHGHSAKPYDHGFLSAYEAYPKHDEKSESEREYLEAVKRLMAGERDKAPMSHDNAETFLRAAAEDYARKMAAEAREQSKIRSMRRWLSNGTYLDFAPQPRVEYIELSPEQSAEQWERDFGRAAHCLS